MGDDSYFLVVWVCQCDFIPNRGDNYCVVAGLYRFSHMEGEVETPICFRLDNRLGLVVDEKYGAQYFLILVLV